MSPQLILALVGLITALTGGATGIVALRKVGTDNAVAVRTIANTESDSTMSSMSKFNETLRADNIIVHQQLTDERAAHDKTRGELAEALRLTKSA